MVSSVEEGRGSSISSSSISSRNWGIDNRGSLDLAGNSSVDFMKRLSYDSRGSGLLDNGLTRDSNRDGDIVRGIHMDWDRDLNNVILVDWGIIGDVDLTLNQDRGLDIVDLNLFLDDGGIVGNRSLEDSWDSNGKMRGGGLEDPGVVARDIAGLSKVDLLGDNGGRLVDSGDSRSLSSGGEWCRGCWSNIRGLREGGNITGNKSMASRGRSKALGGTNSNTSRGNTSSQRCGSQAKTGIGWGSTSHGQDKGKSNERSHVASC